MTSVYTSKILKGSPPIPKLLERLARDKAALVTSYEAGEWEYTGMEKGEEAQSDWWISGIVYREYVHIRATMPKLKRNIPKYRMSRNPREAVKFEHDDKHQTTTKRAYYDEPIMIFNN